MTHGQDFLNQQQNLQLALLQVGQKFFFQVNWYL